MARVGGIIQFKIDGTQYAAKGEFSYGYGYETRTSVNGVDRIHGFRTEVVPPFVEGEITDTGDISLEAIAGLTDATITLELGNGKIFALYHAFSVNPDGMVGNTDESNIAVRFEGLSARDVR